MRFQVLTTTSKKTSGMLHRVVW